MIRVPLLPLPPHRPARAKRTRPSPSRRRCSRGSVRRLPGMLVALGAAASTGCDGGPVVADPERFVGHIDFSDIGDLAPRIPETATASVPLRVTVWTRGSGCYEPGETEVAVDGRTAVVTPYDYVDTSAGGCTDDLRFFEHSATVTFTNPGPAEIVLRYSTNPGKPTGDGRATYTVAVSPAG